MLLLRKWEIKKIIKARIIAGAPKKECTRLAFTPDEMATELEWEHDAEFEYQGQMYDVVEKTVRVDSVIFWCIWDKAETGINRQLESVVALAAGQDTPRQNTLQHLFSFLESLFFTPPAPTPLLFAGIDAKNHSYHFFHHHIPFVPLAPPPES
jgi:hypothetical protein